MNFVSSIGGPALALRSRVTKWSEAMTPGQRKVGNSLSLFGLVMLTSFASAEPVFAQANLESFSQSVLNLLSNSVLRTVSVLAIIAAGFGWLAGRVNTGALVTVIIGIALIFSAPWIVDQLNA